MDGMPGLQRGVATRDRAKVAPIEKMVGPWAPENRPRVRVVRLSSTLIIAILTFLLGVMITKGSMMYVM